METAKPRQEIKVTINPNQNTDLILSGWPIQSGPEEYEESSRVALDYNGKSYSLVINNKGAVELEIWQTDVNGDLLGLLQSYDLGDGN